MPRARHLQQGDDAEAACCRFLIRQGLKLIERNYHCRFGEIDLVMRDGDVVVFTEVRFRSNKSFGGGLESVTPAKQEKLRKAAEHYLQQHDNCNARFDVVSVSKNHQTGTEGSASFFLDLVNTGLVKHLKKDNEYNFDWVTNAF